MNVLIGLGIKGSHDKKIPIFFYFRNSPLKVWKSNGFDSAET